MTTTAVPPQPQAPPRPRPARLTGTVTAQLERGAAAALGLLVSAQFVVMLDTSIVNVALPSIQADLALSPTGLTWVVNAYVLDLRRPAAAVRPCRRPVRPPPHVHRRLRAVHRSAPWWPRPPATSGCWSPAASSRAPAQPRSARPPCRCCC